MRTILSLCDYSGTWSQPYREAGYHVIQVDPKLPDFDTRFMNCTVQDLLDPFYRKVLDKISIHGILMAPPCTDFAVSGAQYWRAKDDDGRTSKSLSIVDACLEVVRICKPEWWCLENPVGRLPVLRPELGKPRVYVQPYEFAKLADDPYLEAYTKKTGLWGEFNLKGLLALKDPVPPVRVCDQGSWIQKLGGKSERTKTLRSVTPTGFSRAFFKANP